MTQSAILNHLDEVLLQLYEVTPTRSREFPSPKVTLIDRTGKTLVIDPVVILRIIVRGQELDELDDEDADLGPLQKQVEGPLKGGKIGVRDKWFGYGNNVGFKRWWHRIGKKSLGRDLESKKEADRWYNTYKGAQLMVNESIFSGFTRFLSYREQGVATDHLLIIASSLLIARQS